MNSLLNKIRKQKKNIGTFAIKILAPTIDFFFSPFAASSIFRRLLLRSCRRSSFVPHRFSFPSKISHIRDFNQAQNRCLIRDRVNFFQFFNYFLIDELLDEAPKLSSYRVQTDIHLAYINKPVLSKIEVLDTENNSQV